MRVLFTTQPGFGHLNPMLPYAMALRAAGVEVRFASSASFAEAVQRHGFPCEPIGVDFTWEHPERAFPDIVAAAKAGQGMEYAMWEINWPRWHPRATRDLLALFEHWRPDVIVREFAEQGATYAGELAGIPVVCAAWTALPGDGRAWSVMLDWERMLAADAALRAEVGLPPTVPGEAWDRQPALSGLPPLWFDGPSNVHHFRLLADRRDARHAPDWLARMGVERPLIYATLGTVFNRHRRTRAAFLEALGDLDADVLMTIGRDVDPDDVGPSSSNIRLERFVPQSLVMPRADLLLSHAGLGTMLGALYAGVRMVLVAIDGDQPVNARRAAELELARVFGLHDATPAALAGAARDVLGDGQRRQRAEAMRQECARLAPIEAVTGVLEQVATPVVAA